MGNIFTPRFSLEHHFTIQRAEIARRIAISDKVFDTTLACPTGISREPEKAWMTSYLRGGLINFPSPARTLNMIDLFSGAGGLAYGVMEAGRSLALEVRTRLAVDLDSEALDIYDANNKPDLTRVADVQNLVDYKVLNTGQDAQFAYPPQILDQRLQDLEGATDLIIAGPPCQGHSNLNNKTRRSDHRNLLYLTAPAAAIALNARAIVIENVPDVLNDKFDVVTTARALLIKAGYSIDETLLSAADFGVAQTRRRHFLVGIRNPQVLFNLRELTESIKIKGLHVGDAIGDLLGREGSTIFHTAAQLSEENRTRVDWLFDENEDDLADHVRPKCHQNGHTYKSVYGRLRLDGPSGTITTGFLTPGRGRYVHPLERRGLTPHEGARLQGFPDSFRFEVNNLKFSKKRISKVIGDAVPPALGSAIGLVTLALSEFL